LGRGLPARAITYTIALRSRSAPKTRERGFWIHPGCKSS
jgi:hypothetical protein